VASTVIWLLLAVVFNDWLADTMSIPAAMVIFVVLESFSTAMLMLYNDYLAVNFLSKKYLMISLVYAVSGMALSVLLVTTVFSEMRYMGRALGTMIPYLCIAGYILFSLYKTKKPKINREYWRYGLKISLPIVPHGLSQLILGQFDRIMIKKLVSDAAAGFYSFANNIGFIFQIVTSSIDTAWTPWLFAKLSEKDYGTIRKSSNIYAAAVAALACGLFLISPELILIMGGAEYNEGRYVVIPIVLSVYFSFMYSLPSGIEYFYKKTGLIAIGTMGAAVLNVILNSIFIGLYGYRAAAYTTVFCYACYYVIHTFVSRKIHGSFLYDMRVMSALVVGTTVFAFLCLWLVDRMWIRMSILAVALIIALIVAFKNKDKLIALVKGFIKK
jgi:O-antigen/teichoic acid export membrane protein